MALVRSACEAKEIIHTEIAETRTFRQTVWRVERCSDSSLDRASGISFFGKQHLVQQTDNIWGGFRGAIYRDFTLWYPATILSGPIEDRRAARPLVRYRVKGKDFKGRLVTGETGFGGFVCHLLPLERAVLGNTSLAGEIKDGERTIAFTVVGPRDSMTEIGWVKSTSGQWTLSLSVFRPNPAVQEGDAVIKDSECGEIARLERRNFSWREQIGSRLGFGRSRRGHFLPLAEPSLSTPDKARSFLFLLVCYFHLLEPSFNTDMTSS